MPVVDLNNKLIGIITEKDILNFVFSGNLKTTKVKTIMTKNVTTFPPDAEAETIAKVWCGLESQTVDFGIMEGANNVSVIPADDLGWCDVGGWSRMFEVKEIDRQGNMIQAKNSLVVDAENTLLYQDENAENKRLIVALGTDDLIVVDMEDVLLVCPKEKSEGVREVVRLLQEKGLEKYL